MRPFDLVIFDCDGVLVDSELISTETLRETLGRHGFEVDLGYVHRTYLGRSFSVVEKDYSERVGRAMSETFEADFLARLFAAFQRNLRTMAGVERLLENLEIPYCMATSSSIGRAELSLKVTGLLPLFEGQIFCASMVAQGKPAPDLFLHAAERMGAAPARSLVIEDSAVGVLAAQNAGMSVWRFVGGSHLKDQPENALDADAGVPLFRRMEDVAAALAGEGSPALANR